MTLLRLEVGPPKDRVGQRKLKDASRTKIDQARRGLGATPTHGEVLAELDFGFWTFLTRKERTATIWTPMLAAAFSPKTDRGHVHQLVDQVRKFRNRLAHNEPTFSNRTGLVNRLTELMNLFDYIHPTAANWVRDHSTTPSLIPTCPVPSLVPNTAGSWLDRP